jgi:hypothetical protein
LNYLELPDLNGFKIRKNDGLNREVFPNWNIMPNPKQELSTKLYGNPQKLALKYINSMMKIQVDDDVETLDSLNLEVIQI